MGFGTTKAIDTARESRIHCTEHSEIVDEIRSKRSSALFSNGEINIEKRFKTKRNRKHKARRVSIGFDKFNIPNNDDNANTVVTLEEQTCPDFGIPSCRLERFLLDFHRAALMATGQSEIDDIAVAVRNMVEYLLSRLETTECRFRCKEIVPTGSVHDGTKILRPDEFDFLAVLEDDSSDLGRRRFALARECAENAGFGHVKLIGMDIREKWAHVSHANKVVSVDKTGGGLCSFREQFRLYFHAIVGKYRGYKLNTPSGDLVLRGFSVSINGPECTLDARWKTKVKGSSDIDISIDVCPAFKSDQIDVIRREDVPHVDTWELLQATRTLYLIPKPVRSCCHCFKLVFASQDQTHVKSLSPNHKQCLVILKYLANIITSKYFCTKVALSSFVMKTLLVHHSLRCKQTISTSSCVLDVLKEFKHILSESPLNIPSVFIENRNVLKKLARAHSDVLKITQTAVGKAVDLLQQMQNTLVLDGYSYRKYFNTLQSTV